MQSHGPAKEEEWEWLVRVQRRRKYCHRPLKMLKLLPRIAKGMTTVTQEASHGHVTHVKAHLSKGHRRRGAHTDLPSFPFWRARLCQSMPWSAFSKTVSSSVEISFLESLDLEKFSLALKLGAP